MKIVENEIFLSPRVALDDRMIKLERSPMKNQEERDDIEERRKKEAWKAPIVIFSLFSREDEE